MRDDFISLSADGSRPQFAGKAALVFQIYIGNTPSLDASMHFASTMPHPIRILAHGRPVYSIPIIVFINDVSANVSKLWNKHYVCYMSNAALPRRKIDQEYNVCFVTSSPNVSPLEIMQGICESFEYASAS
jgi:hypothetical protein